MPEPATPARTLEQDRAVYALEVVRRHLDRGDPARYATLVRGLPAMVLQNGFGQALAYLLADAEGDAKKPSRSFYDELQDWLVGDSVAGRRERVYPSGDLITALMAGSRAQYQRAQRSAVDLLSWMRKFADAYLPKGDR